MPFNSIDFAIFLPIVFILYWFVTGRNLRLQNILIVVVSYIFYGWWDWRFLGLIFLSTVVDYIVGLQLFGEHNQTKRKIWLWTSIGVNLGLLGFFKYYNFFLENFITAFSFFGTDISTNSLCIILPVGISFYTFQTISYSIDVYRGKVHPTKDFIAFTAFVSFFPQLVAGPIERATHLLPQFYKKRTFDYTKAVDGMRQILWGLCKKIVIADNCAQFANNMFSDHVDQSGYSLILGVFFFAFQIYGDFSGYSDIALGTSKLFGFNLTQNFRFPYFSRNMAEFWRRWHISLSTWFRDYVYIPLGGSRGSTKMHIRNIFIVFTLSGLWHGANWTFIVWGILNALYLLPGILTKNAHKDTEVVAQGKILPSIQELFLMITTFGLTLFGWIFFRAENIEHAFSYIQKIYTGISQYPSEIFMSAFWSPYLFHITLIAFFLGIEWLGREKEYGIANWANIPSRILRWFLYGLLIFLMGILVKTYETPFIYFQF